MKRTGSMTYNAIEPVPLATPPDSRLGPGPERGGPAWPGGDGQQRAARLAAISLCVALKVNIGLHSY